MSIGPDSNIAIVGAGTMGSGIAQIAAQAGHHVTLIDASAAALDRSREGISRALDRLEQRGRIPPGGAAAVMARLHFTDDLAAAASAALVIEAIVEQAQAKSALFHMLEGIVGRTACIASNTSSLSINDLAKGLDHQDRFAGLHFFNPVPAMKLVEVVPASATDPVLVNDLVTLMQRWGKIAVVLRDVPGFIVNRVARPYYAEGFAALSEGVPASTIDHLLESAGGFRLGPLALADMIGHDINCTAAASIHAAYDGKTRFRPQPAQQALVDAGHLGRKTGRGVHDYATDLAPPPFITPGPPPAALRVAADAGLLAPLVDAARKAGLQVDVDTALPAGHLVCHAARVAMGDGRLLAQRDDADVLIDHARDLATATCLGVVARDDGAAEHAAALLAVLGKQALRLPDRAGGLVLRTLAQLANAAADALADGIGSADAIDAAMRHGANHPEGPLAWAARFGHEALGEVMDGIAAATADTLYSPAATFRHGITPA